MAQAQPVTNPPRELTPWAQKYGEVETTGHSGYTPTTYMFPSLGFQPLPGDPIALETHQKKIFMGFTSQELFILDCLPTRELQPGNLALDIIPLFDRTRWQTGPIKPDLTRDNLYPLSDGRGLWLGDNDVVWDMMEPILRLASQMIMATHLLPWFDALVSGERKEIDDNRVNARDLVDDDGNRLEHPLQSFWETPNGYDTEKLAQQREAVFNMLISHFNYTFGFFVAYEHPIGPELEKMENGVYAITFTNSLHMQFDNHIPDKKPRVFTFLGTAFPEMLFRTDLNSTERMQIEWHIANTLVHEAMHAIGFLYTDLAKKYTNLEPYFEDEPVAELGYSFENALNMGSSIAMLSEDNPNTSTMPLPLGFWIRKQWPDLNDGLCSQMPILDKPGPFDFNDLYPVPSLLYEDMQQKDFWEVGIKAFGGRLFHFRVGKEGSRIDLRVDENGDLRQGAYQRISSADHPFALHNNQYRNSLNAMMAAVDMMPEDKRAIKFATEILMSSQLEQAYWNDSQAQREQVQNVQRFMTEWSTGLTVDAIKSAVFQALTEIHQKMMTNHETMIANVMSMESLNNTTYPDRRDTLRMWNRGTRAFLRTIETDLAGATNPNMGINAELVRLERCRIILWDPTDATYQHGQDWLELQSVQQFTTLCEDPILTQQKGDLFKATRAFIRSQPDLSIFAECAVAVGYFEKLGNVSFGWEQRLRDVRACRPKLDTLSSGGCTVFFRSPLRNLFDRVRTIINAVDVGGLRAPTTPPFFPVFMPILYYAPGPGDPPGSY